MSLSVIGWQTRLVTPNRRRAAARQIVLPCLEALEDRSLPALGVTNLAAPAAALTEVLAGNGLTINNVTFTGTTGNGTASAGIFTGGNGIMEGMILSNGHAADVVGLGSNFATTDSGCLAMRI
jgi:hypothetical protein